MGAEQGVEAVELFDADTTRPIHYDDFEVSQSPLSDPQEAIEEAGLGDRMAYVEHGDTVPFEVSVAQQSSR